VNTVWHLITSTEGIQFILVSGFALLAVIFALGLITLKNPVHAALSLIGNFICLAGIYLLLGSFVMGVMQLVVYAGAIMVLFLFVIMFFFTPKPHQELEISKSPLGFIAWVSALALVLFGLLIGFIWSTSTTIGAQVKGGPIQTHKIVNFDLSKGPRSEPFSSNITIGETPAKVEIQGGGLVVAGTNLLSQNIVAFELTSLLLLTAIIGSVVLVKELSSPRAELPLKEISDGKR